MNNEINTADGISRWTSMGVKLPAELTRAIELFENVRYVELGHQPRIDLGSMNPKNAEKKIRDLAAEYALSATPQGGGWSPLEQAKREIVEAAARVVNNQARQAIPGIIEQLTPGFESSAEAYTEAVGKLPAKGLTVDSLAEAGSEALDAYQIARSEAAQLILYTGLVASTAALVADRDPELLLLALQPDDALQLAKIDEAAEKEPKEGVGPIDPVFYAAARNGVRFGLNTLGQAKALRRSLALKPQKLGVPA